MFLPEVSLLSNATLGVLPYESGIVPNVSILLLASPLPCLTSVLSSEDVCDLFKLASPFLSFRQRKGKK